MKNSITEKERVETKQMLELSSLDEKRKKRFLEHLPNMNRAQLAKLRIHLKRLMMIDASQETIDEIIEKKEVPEDEGALWEKVLSKVMEKVDKVEERTRQAVA